MKIAIAGPGRSGTSFLVGLLAGWGLTTPASDSNWHEDAQAGLEHRIGQDSHYEVDKDPWLFEYISQLTDEQLALYDAVIVPLRTQDNVALSRSIQERYSRAVNLPDDFWTWNSWGTIPGGSLSDISREGTSRVLQAGLWTLLEQLTARGIQPLMLNFPRIALDFDYVWENLGRFVDGRITREDAHEVFTRLADKSKIRVGDTDDTLSHITREELIGIIDMLRKNVREKDALIDSLQNSSADAPAALSHENPSARVDLLLKTEQALHSELAALSAERDSLKFERDLLRSQLVEQDSRPHRKKSKPGIFRAGHKL